MSAHATTREAPPRDAATRTGLPAHVAVFLALLALTALEFFIVRLPVDRALRVTTLLGLSLTKAGLMLMTFMNLRREAWALRGLVLVPLLLAPLFAIALMLDTVFRVSLR
jgi:cytochrome c oxidase subunit IV